ncbi:hypothetical protein SAMN05443582_101407 [Phyllobacterium sp. OV277]|nr:hypothetical protein SAMN05443582_101407 [Phyllobacterium sp. OV277]
MIFCDSAGPIYSPQDLATMRKAYAEAFRMLDLGPRSKVYAQEISLIILQIFTSGVSDVKRLAELAVDRAVRKNFELRLTIDAARAHQLRREQIEAAVLKAPVLPGTRPQIRSRYTRN